MPRKAKENEELKEKKTTTKTKSLVHQNNLC